MEEERPLTLKIWFPLTIITCVFSQIINLPRYLTPPPAIPPELIQPYINARLLFWLILILAALVVAWGVWIGNRIAYFVMYIILIWQIVNVLLGFTPSMFWLYEAIVQMALLAFSWQYFFK